MNWQIKLLKKELNYKIKAQKAIYLQLLSRKKPKKLFQLNRMKSGINLLKKTDTTANLTVNLSGKQL